MSDASDDEGPGYLDGYWDGYDKASRDYTAASDKPDKPSDKSKDKPGDNKQTEQKYSVSACQLYFDADYDTGDTEDELERYCPPSPF